MTSVQKHLQLILDWMDKGFSSGANKAKLDIDDLKRKARELALALAGTVTALAAATLALFKFIAMGAGTKDVADTFDRVREKAGLLPDVLGKIREATRGTVTDMDLMKGSSRALADSLDPSRLVEFWAKAKQISAVSGVPVKDVFEALALAITKLNTLNLTATGITIRTETAFENYAKTINKTTADLTYLDKQTAISIELEAKYQKQFAALGDISSGVNQRFQQFGVSVKNLKDKFFMMLADSPAVERFMAMLISKIGTLSTKLDEAEPKIKAGVDQFLRFYDNIVNFDETKVGKAIDFMLRYKEQIIGIGIALGTGEIASKIAGLGVAMGLLSKVGASGLGIVIGGTIGLWATLIMQIRGAAAETDNLTGSIRTQHFLLRQFDKLNIYDINFGPWKFINDRIEQIEKLNRTIKDSLETGFTLSEKLAKITAPGLFGFKFPFPPTPTPSEAPDKWGNPPKPSIPEPEAGAFPLTIESGIITKKIGMYEDYDQKLRDIRGARSDWEIALIDIELEMERRGMEMRMALYEKGFQAMSVYSYKFYRDHAHRAQTLNAMLIRGFGEVLASYIEAKGKEAAINAAEYAYKAIVAASLGYWGSAAGLIAGAAGATALAAGAYAGATAVRYWSQEKAERISALEPAGLRQPGDLSETTGQRRQATGIVNTRPIAINVYSNTYFQSGYNIFGDSESAVNDFYNGKIRSKIEGDIESGMIAIPA